jgi:hypothetical protein
MRFLRDDKFNSLLQFMMMTELSDAPFFTRHSNYFNAEIGDTVEIYCLYRSSPQAKSVKWISNGEQIHNSQKYTVLADQKDHHERTKLLIRNVDASDLRSYQCEVKVGIENSLNLMQY